MIVVKVPVKEAQKVLNYARGKDLVDNNYEILAQNDFLFFVATKKDDLKDKFSLLSFSKKKLKKKVRKETDLKKALSKHLSEKESEQLITSYDVVGNVAILEVPDSLKRKEKIIANTLLDTQNNIKTVLRKEGIHKGRFRTQKMKHLAGVRTKETNHRENNVQLKLNVEDVYFSTRSSYERKRVIEQVKKDEDVLVMFSGCGPFVCSIAKNSDARNVFGVELNPEAHRYAEENVKLNNLNNAKVILGDVRKITPEFYNQLIGLKSDTQLAELSERLVEQPRIFEFHLNLPDLFEKKARLEVEIRSLKKKGIKDIILHMPFYNFKGERLSLDKKNIKDELKIFAVLGELCIKHDIKAVVHPFQKSDESTKDCPLFIRNIRKLRKYFDYFFFENDSGGFFGDADHELHVAQDTGMKNLCFDVCHSFLVHKSNKKVLEHIRKLKDFNLYFHLADSNGKSHGTPIGSGKINFNKILPYVRRGVAEVTSKDEMHPIEMISSYETLISKKRLFDRIVMPLPKSAETFLDVAFAASKKGTIIHLYTFLKEEEIPSKAKQMVEKAARKSKKKIKVLDVVKCGTYSPRTFRVCIDFKVLN